MGEYSDANCVEVSVFSALGSYLIDNREMLIELLLDLKDADDVAEAQRVIDDLGHELIRRMMAIGRKEPM